MIRNVAVKSGAIAVALTLSGVASHSAGAEPAPVSEHFVGRAGSQVADLSLLGRHSAFGSATADSDLEAVGDRLAASATGLGSTLVAPATKSVARFKDDSAQGGPRCATPALGPVLDQAAQKAPAGVAGGLPAITLSAACGGASVTGDPKAFSALATGGGTRLAVKLPAALEGQAAELVSTLTPKVLATPVGQLVASSPAASESKVAVEAVNGFLRTIAPGITLSQVEPTQTVGSLIQRVGTGDLLHINLAGASARNAGDATAYVSEALNQGGVIEVLPGFRGPDSGPLLRISVAESRAAVNIDRATTRATPTLKNTVVRIEGDLLSSLPIAGPTVLDGKVNGTPLEDFLGGDLPVVGGLLGAGMPFGPLTRALGLRSGSNFLELGPGQSVSLLCDGPAAVLCSEVSVGAATEPVTLPNGVTRVQASTASASLFKGLDHLAPTLGTLLANPEVARIVEPLAASAGITLGEPTGLGGIRLTVAGAVAEAGGTRVLGSGTRQAAAGDPPVATTAPAPAPTPIPATAAAAVPRADAAPLLPRTGGLPLDPRLVPILLGSAVALGALSRQVRSGG